MDRTSYGCRLILDGHLSRAELEQWREALEQALKGAPTTFGVLVDARRLQSIDPDAVEILVDGIVLLRTRGARNADVALGSAETAPHFDALARLPSLMVPRGPS